MSYIFGKLWHLAIIWAIRKAFQCILQGVRLLLANHARLSPTSEKDSYAIERRVHSDNNLFALVAIRFGSGDLSFHFSLHRSQIIHLKNDNVIPLPFLLMPAFVLSMLTKTMINDDDTFFLWKHKWLHHTVIMMISMKLWGVHLKQTMTLGLSLTCVNQQPPFQ